ncbi:hypothetical protein A3A71_01880 [Candidatus Berkelbacteria bacterium RIFCSPLOWO2_01_FULL_50_28]|uniref:Prenyltransferase n=1 Tax=Candidatus Berkelbacteria bacterium RIFCSPLOWO2_01_FULL_50_28 TaxID=1797471 RepID=A0A1F5EBY2_9BACT|nr:MAG: hypothetical protein A3F39_00155 [Candidatus Berkelbacteria bacterium RIFCSPHIGHO2_12_FULL_50_11]OGD64776.1 MAG: hypothetical protein A3A71_01880 [Candidatus Berkelbacteria bacterium RIFCSPLOWO2_01_FULL_50_28]
MFKHYLLNLRPYSWVDFILLGWLAKFWVNNQLGFETKDFYLAAAILLLWAFYNILLELVKGYQERGTMSVFPAIIALLTAVVLGYVGNNTTLVWVVISTVFVVAYLLKERVRFFGQINNLVRGLIQASYLLFAIAFYNAPLTGEIWWLAGAIVSLIFARSLVGDIRDVKHDAKINKQTLPVVLGIPIAKTLSTVAILVTILVTTLVLNVTWAVTLPLWLFALAVILYRNGYVLHQLSVLTTSAFAVNLIFVFTGQDLVIINLVYVGIFLNQIYYPLLSRKSNPTFVQT